MIDLFAKNLLRRHVTHRPHDGSRTCVYFSGWYVGLCLPMVHALEEFCQTKVKYFHAVIVGYENVFWFQISVDNAFVMRSRKAMSDLQSVVNYSSIVRKTLRESFP